MRYARRYVLFAVGAVLLALAAASCSAPEAETVALGEANVATPKASVTRAPRAVETTVPRRTPAPLGSPSAPLLITPLATVTPGGTITATQVPTATPTPAVSPTAMGTAVTSVTPMISPTLTPTVSLTLTPTPMGSPTPARTLTPVPGATTTGTPVPSRQVQAAAGSLAQKTMAFREAVEVNDTNAMLRLQRELLEEADKAESSIKEDNSPFAEHLRSAIRAIREGASGDMGKLDAAARELSEATGNQEVDQDARDQGTRTPAVSPQELRSMAESLSRKVESFEESVRSRNPENTLRQQKELLDEMNRIEQAVKNDRTKQGEQIRSALEAVRNALSGDENKLDDARRALRRALED